MNLTWRFSAPIYTHRIWPIYCILSSIYYEQVYYRARKRFMCNLVLLFVVAHLLPSNAMVILFDCLLIALQLHEACLSSSYCCLIEFIT